MQDHTFRHRITTGSFTLPVTALSTTVLWTVFNGGDGPSSWITLAVTAVVTYMLIELNNRFALLRIRSRMVSVTFLALTAACPFVHRDIISWLPAAGLALCLFPLFTGYQSPRERLRPFYTFFILSAAALVYPPLLLLAPVLLFGMAAWLRSLGGRGLAAALLGLLVPPWLLLGFSLWTDTFTERFTPLRDALLFLPPRYETLSAAQWASAGWLAAVSLCATVHFLRYAFGDKIRTRMYLYLIISLETVLWAALCLQPQSFDPLFRLLLVVTAPVIGHYFALARGRLMNAWFLLCLASLVVLGIYNYGG